MADMGRSRLLIVLTCIFVAVGGGIFVADTAGAIAQAGKTGGSTLRYCTVKAFDPASGTLTITVAGTDYSKVPYNPAYLPLIGDTVAVMNTGATWYVMGSTTNVLARTLPVAASVDTFEQLAGTGGSMVDLPTVGPSVTVMVGASGRVLVSVSVNIQPYEQSYGFAAVALSGANTLTADANPDFVVGFNPADIAIFSTISAAGTTLMTGLNPGLTTFKLRYSATLFDPSNKTGFEARNLVVTPY